MTALRVAVIADYLEEGWPSMDLVADMLFDRLQREHSAAIVPTLVRPPMQGAGASPDVLFVPRYWPAFNFFVMFASDLE